MGIAYRICILTAMASVAGCTTIWKARDAQREYESLARDDGCFIGTNRVDLSTYSLSQLVDFAMTNRPTMISAALAVEDARLALKQLRADAPLISETPWLSPHLSVNGGYSAASESAQLKDLSWRTEGRASASFNLSIPLYDFGRHDARVKAQCEAVLDAELRLVDTGYLVFYEVSDAYFTLLERCALVAVAQTNVVECQLHLEQVEKRLDAGEAMELDVLQARLALARANEKVVGAQLDQSSAFASFQKSVGLDSSFGSGSEVIEFTGDPLRFVIRGFPDTDYTVSEAFSLARTNAPIMRVARSRLRAASADVDYAIADLMPEISASVSLNWTDPVWYWRWGVSAVQSVFQGFRKTTAVDRAVIALRQAAASVEEEELSISVSLEMSVAARDAALKAQETASASLREARNNLEAVRLQYQVGDVSQVEYSAAVSAYVESMGARISAFYLKQRAESAVFSLIGIYPVYEEKRLMEGE